MSGLLVPTPRPDACCIYCGRSYRSWLPEGMISHVDITPIDKWPTQEFFNIAHRHGPHNSVDLGPLLWRGRAGEIYGVPHART